MTTLRSYAHQLGGEAASRNRVLCPGPGHSRHDRSLSVTFTGDDYNVHSFAGDEWRDCRDHVRALLGLPDGNRVRLRPSRAPGKDDDATRRTTRALELWHEAQPITGTLAETYLARRGLIYSGDALRWHPSCPFGKDDLGCMVALIRNVATNEPQAIHRTAIDAEGHKIDRKALGPIGGGAVKLTADEDVTTSLHIAEGIETALAVAAMGFLPVWSCISATGMRAFPALAGIEALTIFADNDASRTGIEAATECASRWQAAGVETFILEPPAIGEDFADLKGREQ